MTFQDLLEKLQGLDTSNPETYAEIAWNAALEEAEKVALEVGEDAYEASKAKDATDYVAGYQDAAVDVQEELRHMKTNGADK